jgi:hypothetical protein
VALAVLTRGYQRTERHAEAAQRLATAMHAAGRKQMWGSGGFT